MESGNRKVPAAPDYRGFLFTGKVVMWAENFGTRFGFAGYFFGILSIVDLTGIASQKAEKRGKNAEKMWGIRNRSGNKIMPVFGRKRLTVR